MSEQTKERTDFWRGKSFDLNLEREREREGERESGRAQDG